MKRIVAAQGEHVVHLVVRGIREARHLKQPIELVHNGSTVVVDQHSSEDETYSTFTQYEFKPIVGGRK
jgi:hypothetical protein